MRRKVKDNGCRLSMNGEGYLACAVKVLLNDSVLKEVPHVRIKERVVLRQFRRRRFARRQVPATLPIHQGHGDPGMKSTSE